MKSWLGGAILGMASITFYSFALSAAGPVDIAKLQQFKKSCEGLPTTITRSQIRIAMNQKLFPGPSDNMGEFMESIEKGLIRKRDNENCSPHLLYRESKVVPPIFLDVAKKATSLLVKDMKSQQDLARDGLQCAEKLEAFAKTQPSFQISSMTTEQIDAFTRTTTKPEMCREFATKYIPTLQERFETMRTFLAMGTDQVDSSSITTDESMLSTLIAPYFPTVWRKEAARKLAPLSEDRRKSLSDMKSLKTDAKEAALQRSYDILSTSPLLAMFSDTPDAKSIASAFRVLNRQTAAENIKDIEKTAPQEITLLLPYVMQTLAQMPYEKRGDACLIFQELQENMVKRYIKMPFWGTAAGLAFAAAGGFVALPATVVRSGSAVKTVGQGLMQFMKGFSPAGSATMMAAGATAGSNGLRDYLYKTKLCSAITDAPDATKRVASLCDFGAAEAGLQATQESVFVQTALGLTLFGVGRYLK